MLFAKKILIVFIVSSSPLDTESKSLFVLLILIFAIFLNLQHSPFHTKNLNSLELNQCFTIMLIVLSGLTSYRIENDYFSMFCVVVIIILNSQFLWHSIKAVLIFKIAKYIKFSKKNKGKKKSRYIPFAYIGFNFSW